MKLPCYMFSVPIGAYPPFKIKEEAWARQAVLERFNRTGIPSTALWGYQLLPGEEEIITEISPDLAKIRALGFDETQAYMETLYAPFAESLRALIHDRMAAAEANVALMGWYHQPDLLMVGDLKHFGGRFVFWAGRQEELDHRLLRSLGLAAEDRIYRWTWGGNFLDDHVPIRAEIEIEVTP